ncbi:unnamed protein product [Boreogadus saida]
MDLSTLASRFHRFNSEHALADATGAFAALGGPSPHSGDAQQCQSDRRGAASTTEARTMSLSAANRSPIAIEGAFFARLSTAPSDSGVTSCRSTVYVSSSVRTMHLSYESLLSPRPLPCGLPIE